MSDTAASPKLRSRSPSTLGLPQPLPRGLAPPLPFPPPLAKAKMGDLTIFSLCSVGLAGKLGELILIAGTDAKKGDFDPFAYPPFNVAGELATEPGRRGRRLIGAGMGSVLSSSRSSSASASRILTLSIRVARWLAPSASSSVVAESEVLEGPEGLVERGRKGRGAGAGRWNRSCGSGWLESPTLISVVAHLTLHHVTLHHALTPWSAHSLTTAP